MRVLRQALRLSRGADSLKTTKLAGGSAAACFLSLLRPPAALDWERQRLYGVQSFAVFRFQTRRDSCTNIHQRSPTPLPLALGVAYPRCMLDCFVWSSLRRSSTSTFMWSSSFLTFQTRRTTGISCPLCNWEPEMCRMLVSGNRTSSQALQAGKAQTAVLLVPECQFVELSARPW